MIEWKARVLDKSLSVSANSLSPTCESVIGELLNGRVVDLSGFTPKLVNPVHLAVVLRTCYSQLNLTIGWSEALNVCHAACILEYIDAQDVLCGLLPR